MFVICVSWRVVVGGRGLVANVTVTQALIISPPTSNN
jgi:hypothetical protein